MAPVTKPVSKDVFIYEKNNFVAFTDTTQVPVEFHHLMNFIKNCKLSHAMLASPALYCEVIEAYWTSARYDAGSKTLTYTYNYVDFSITGKDIRVALKLPEDTTDKEPTHSDIVDMLESINYVGETSNLGKIYRKA